MGVGGCRPEAGPQGFCSEVAYVSAGQIQQAAIAALQKTASDWYDLVVRASARKIYAQSLEKAG